MRNIGRLPHYSEEQILAWADAYHEIHGRWPGHKSGPIEGAPGETWNSVQVALDNGCRGLPCGSSLASLLARERGMRYSRSAPPLTERTILEWADAHHAAFGCWPKKTSGAVVGAPGDTWLAVDAALSLGGRGLPCGSSLPRLLARHRGVRNPRELPALTMTAILAWADQYYAQHGRWPAKKSGHVPGTAHETWLNIDSSLRLGTRGLQGGITLFRLLQRHRGAKRANAAKAQAGGRRLKAGV